jgi:acetyltransferase-like isoleucine patch superfamily enzyme
MANKIASDATIMSNVTIGDNVTIGKCSLIYPNVKLEDNVAVGAFCIIGEPTMDYYSDNNHEFAATIIGKGSIIRANTSIYEGVVIGESFQTGHHVTIRENTRIGHNCSVGTLSDLQGYIEIGNYVRLHSNVHLGQQTKIDDFVWIYPYVVTTNDPYPPMGNLIGCHICQYAQIATGAIILPGKKIGENSLVGAGAVVTKDVQDEALVTGVPAKEICSVREIKDNEGNPLYPWKDHLKQYRGYPWQSSSTSSSTK